MAAVSDDPKAKRAGLREKYTEAAASILDALRKWSKGFYSANELVELGVSLRLLTPLLPLRNVCFSLYLSLSARSSPFASPIFPRRVYTTTRTLTKLSRNSIRRISPRPPHSGMRRSKCKTTLILCTASLIRKARAARRSFTWQNSLLGFDQVSRLFLISLSSFLLYFAQFTNILFFGNRVGSSFLNGPQGMFCGARNGHSKLRDLPY